MRREQAASIHAVIQHEPGNQPSSFQGRSYQSKRRDTKGLSAGVDRKWRLFNALYGMHLVALDQHAHALEPCAWDTRVRVCSQTASMPRQMSRGVRASWHKYKRDFFLRVASVARKKGVTSDKHRGSRGCHARLSRFYRRGVITWAHWRCYNLHFLASFTPRDESRFSMAGLGAINVIERNATIKGPVFARVSTLFYDFENEDEEG